MRQENNSQVETVSTAHSKRGQQLDERASWIDEAVGALQPVNKQNPDAGCGSNAQCHFSASTSVEPQPKRQIKSATLPAPSKRPPAADMKKLMIIKDWQEHSIRPALTDFREAGHGSEQISVTKQDQLASVCARAYGVMAVYGEPDLKLDGSIDKAASSHVAKR